MSEQNERAHFVWRPVRSDQYSRVLSSPSHCCINSQKSHKLTDLANGLMKNPARRAGSPPEVSAQFQLHPLLRIVLDWSAVWFKEGDLLHFYDLLAAVAIFSPEVC